MRFSIIYSVDAPNGINIDKFAPSNVEERWNQTEDDDQYDYGYLEGNWANGSHRKWCAVLNREQFDEFVDQCGLIAEDTETMGAIGSPAFGIGWSPAISFDGGDPNVLQNAYVTPIPEVERKHPSEDDWERVRDAVLAVYG